MPIPDPTNSPNEKLVMPRRTPVPRDLTAYLQREGLELDLAQKIGQAFKQWQHENHYQHVQELLDLEHWANVHTHPGGSGGGGFLPSVPPYMLVFGGASSGQIKRASSLDMTDPEAPSVVSSIGLTEFSARSNRTRTDYVGELVLIPTEADAKIYSISGSAPVEISDLDAVLDTESLPQSTYRAAGIAKGGKRALLASYNDTIDLFNISDPANPVHVDRLVTAWTNMEGGALLGTRFLVASSGKVGLYDFSGDIITEIGEISLTGSPSGGYSPYLLDSNTFLVHFSSGSVHTLISAMIDEDGTTSILNADIAPSGIDPSDEFIAPLDSNHILVMEEGGSEVHVLDLSDPSNPVLVNSYTTDIPGSTQETCAIALGNYLYLTKYEDLRIFDITSFETSLPMVHRETGISDLGYYLVPIEV